MRRRTYTITVEVTDSETRWEASMVGDGANAQQTGRVYNVKEKRPGTYKSAVFAALRFFEAQE